MTKRSPPIRITQRPAAFTKPAYWTNDPAPQPVAAEKDQDPGVLSPTRYGDWVKDGIAVDF